MNSPLSTAVATQFSLTVPGTDERLEFIDNNGGDGSVLAAADFQATCTAGIWDLVRNERRATLDQFASAYAAVRAAEDRQLSPQEARALPYTSPGHPLHEIWTRRAQSYERFRGRIKDQPGGLAVDIGAGSGWLAARLSQSGWTSAALDITVDGGDGLASAAHHDEDLLLVRAEMAALPFASNSIDLAVFNASLHYAASVTSTLAEAKRVVRPGGHLVVLDSPVFSDAAAGTEMVTEFARSLRERFGIDPAPTEGPGFVTTAELADHRFEQIDEAGPVRRQIHRWRSARQLGREAAVRPLLVEKLGASS